MRLFILSLTLVQLAALGRAQPVCLPSTCANGPAVAAVFPNGNFEAPPFAPPTGYISFFAGQSYSNWQVLNGSIDLLGPNTPYYKSGDPNGPSQYIDLSGFTPGTITTTLTGLTPGYHYAINIWYAINPGGPSATCNVQVAGGAWLNETWTATNPGNVIWLEICFSFTAQAATAPISFIGSSPAANAGMLLDNIVMWEQPTLPPPTANAGPDMTICAGTSLTLTASGGTIYNWSNGANTPGISVSPAGTTTYTVTVTVPNCGTDTDEVTVTVNPLPSVSFIAASSELCIGDCQTIQVNFTGTPPFTLSYMDGGKSPQTLVVNGNNTSFQVCAPSGTPPGDYQINALALTDAFCTCN